MSSNTLGQIFKAPMALKYDNSSLSSYSLSALWWNKSFLGSKDLTPLGYLMGKV